MTHIDPFFLRESIDKMIDTINLHAINYHNGKEINWGNEVIWEFFNKHRRESA